MPTSGDVVDLDLGMPEGREAGPGASAALSLAHPGRDRPGADGTSHDRWRRGGYGQCEQAGLEHHGQGEAGHVELGLPGQAGTEEAGGIAEHPGHEPGTGQAMTTLPGSPGRAVPGPWLGPRSMESNEMP
jgi:hypothetical protein